MSWRHSPSCNWPSERVSCVPTEMESRPQAARNIHSNRRNHSLTRYHTELCAWNPGQQQSCWQNLVVNSKLLWPEWMLNVVLDGADSIPASWIILSSSDHVFHELACLREGSQFLRRHSESSQLNSLRELSLCGQGLKHEFHRVVVMAILYGYQLQAQEDVWQV